MDVCRCPAQNRGAELPHEELKPKGLPYHSEGMPSLSEASLERDAVSPRNKTEPRRGSESLDRPQTWRLFLRSLSSQQTGNGLLGEAEA